MAENRDTDPRPPFPGGEHDHATGSKPSPDADQAGQPGISDMSATDEPDDQSEAGSPQDLSEELAEAQEKVASYYDELLRARAEVENIRRRAQEDVAKARKFSIEAFAESLVPVIDSLEAALQQSDQDAAAWQEGVEATLRQLLSAFDRHAMQAVAPEAGDRFDPHLHQAISTVPSEQPEGTIAQRLQKGYTVAERVLRPALVMVSAGPGH